MMAQVQREQRSEPIPALCVFVFNLCVDLVEATSRQGSQLSLTLDGAASERNGLHITVEERQKPSSWTGCDEAIKCSFKLAARTRSM